MKRIVALILICFLFQAGFAFSFKKKQKAQIFMSNRMIERTETMQPVSVFNKGEKIYFEVHNPNGFKSDYVKYQIVKQDDNANGLDAGYTRCRNITKKLKDKNSFQDYFVLHKKGMYYLQIFDIENLQQWVALSAFKVVEE